MAEERTRKMVEAHPMKGGDGFYSYAKNSTYQKRDIDAAREMLIKAIADNLDVETLFSQKTFNIADLGCSVGPNTFFAIQNIIDAVELKYQCQELDCQIPEFQVFFNDHTSNDFNLLFNSFPSDKKYHAAGVPGSFYGRLFPKASIHFVHASSSIHWLSRIPNEVMDKSSQAWNKGKIHLSNSSDEVVRAYEAQYAKDMDQFLHARAEEIVGGGLMVLLVTGRPNGAPHSQIVACANLELLGSCLMDMAKKGIVREEEVDSFNIPMYFMSPEEVERAVERNGCFSIEKMESLQFVPLQGTVSGKVSKQIASHMRAANEALIKNHFGEAILDELFDLYVEKVEENFSMFTSGKGNNFMVLLKRNATSSDLQSM